MCAGAAVGNIKDVHSFGKAIISAPWSRIFSPRGSADACVSFPVCPLTAPFADVSACAYTI